MTSPCLEDPTRTQDVVVECVGRVQKGDAGWNDG